jgi:hypothetical protein
MNTFLPFPSFEESVRVLDNKRLGKQRVEAMQLVNVLSNPDAKGWRNHPATNMWRGHEHALCEYGLACCAEWSSRGFNDTVADKIKEKMAQFPDTGRPYWIGDPVFHAAHRSNLLRKDFEFYSQLGWKEPPDLPYIWPPAKPPGSR